MPDLTAVRSSAFGCRTSNISSAAVGVILSALVMHSAASHCDLSNGIPYEFLLAAVHHTNIWLNYDGGVKLYEASG